MTSGSGAGDDNGIFYVIGDLDVAVTVLNSSKQSVHRTDDDLIGDDVFEIARELPVRFFVLRIPRRRQRKCEQRHDEQGQKQTDKRFSLCLSGHAPTSPLSEACTNSIVSCASYFRLSSSYMK